MDLTIKPAPLRGTVAAIPSKSEAHRLLILAALADAPTEIGLAPGSGEDIERTLSCLQAIGAVVSRSENSIRVAPPSQAAPSPRFPCGESGSTLRFMLPVAAALCGGGHFSGSGRLPERPLGELAAALKKQGMAFSGERLPFTVSGKLRPGEYLLPGNVSSQYVSGLLLALPLLPGASTIRLSGPLESSAYVEMTLGAMRRFGIAVRVSGSRYHIPGGRRYRSPQKVSVEGDWSNASFFLAAGALGGPVAVEGLDYSSLQGDKAMAPLLARFGALTEISGGRVTVSGGALRGCEIDLRQIPDLLPVLAAVAASADGTTTFYGAARLRYKESDRIASTAALINALGGRAAGHGERLVVRGGKIAGGVVQSFNDHRIAMAAAIAAVRAAKPVTIVDAGAVNKSYPTFFDHYLELGGTVDGF